MCTEKNEWERAVEFHGHSCPGLATGYRVAKIALQELSALRSNDEEIVATVENNACGIDAIQVLTGCSAGKGNLIFHDYGKHVYTFACRNSGKAVRIAVKEMAWRSNPSYSEIRKRVLGGTATEEELKTFQKHHHERIQQILDLPQDELCAVRHIDCDLPPKASIHRSHRCAECGESVMEPRARVKGGQIVCIPCFENKAR
ncbi:MAG: FmdE family protein [Eubacteriales bacterium]